MPDSTSGQYNDIDSHHYINTFTTDDFFRDAAGYDGDKSSLTKDEATRYISRDYDTNHDGDISRNEAYKIAWDAGANDSAAADFASKYADKSVDEVVSALMNNTTTTNNSDFDKNFGDITTQAVHDAHHEPETPDHSNDKASQSSSHSGNDDSYHWEHHQYEGPPPWEHHYHDDYHHHHGW